MYHLTKKGKGFLSFDLYKGSVENGKRHGFGLQLFANGCVYLGFWHKNAASGKGRLVLPDSTIYEGSFQNNILQKGIVSYYNGAKYEGTFDGTSFERFKSGTFTFSKGDMFKGEWEDGLVKDGKLIDKTGKVWEFYQKDTIIVKPDHQLDYGLMVSRTNKWFYEGGIRNGKCNGQGIIYCSFQQYKTGIFEDDRVTGNYIKVGLNWGDITEGECVKDKKIGKSIRTLNKGYRIETTVNEPKQKVFFPFLNKDYYEGFLSYPNFEKKPYKFKFKNGVYFMDMGDGQYKEFPANNIDEIWDIFEVRMNGIQFDFTYKKIKEARGNDIDQELSKYLRMLIDIALVKESDLHPFLIKLLKPEIKHDNIQFADSKLWLSKIGETRLHKPSIIHTMVDESKFTERKRGKSEIDATFHQHSFNVQRRNTEFPQPTDNSIDRQRLQQTVVDDKRIKDSFINATVYKPDDHRNFYGPQKTNDISKTIVTRKESKFRSRTPMLSNTKASRIRNQSRNVLPTKKSQVGLKSPRGQGNFAVSEYNISPLKSMNRTITSDEEALKNYKNNEISQVDASYANDKKIVTVIKDVKIIDEDMEFFEGVIIRGKKQDFCKVLYSDGIYKEGYFKDNTMEGKGYLIDKNLVEKAGVFKNDKLSGKGTLRLDRTKYVGQFKNSMFNNQFITTQKNGTIIISEKQKTVKGNINGNVTIYFMNGMKIETELVSNIPKVNKRSKLIEPSGKIHIGKIKEKDGVKQFESLSAPVQRNNLKMTDEGIEIENA